MSGRVNRASLLRALHDIAVEAGDFEEEPVTLGPAKPIIPLRLVKPDGRRTPPEGPIRKGPPNNPRRSKHIPPDPGPPTYDPNSGMSPDEHRRFEEWKERMGRKPPRSVLPTTSWMDAYRWCQPVAVRRP